MTVNLGFMSNYKAWRITLKYENAKNILPEELLTVLQYYAAGTCLYIPYLQPHIKQKYELSSQKQFLLQRNAQIVADYQRGISVKQLAMHYYLSKQAIYKIIKSSKN